jgi:1-phosphofructokinase
MMDATKARFFCLCMSPAIDATVKLPRAPKGDGEIFKDVEEDENVGGKAVNVARWLAIRGADVACGGLLGEDNDNPFARELAKYGIADGFVRVPGATRRNEMITWPGGSVKLNRAAFPGLGSGTTGTLADNVLSQLSHSSQMSHDPSVAILSGSLPPAIPKDFYAKAVSHFKSLGWTVVLDASGEAMRLALDAGPDLIKPNAEECEALIGFVPSTPEEFAKATALLREKAEHVVISDGGAGAWFDGEFVSAPKVDVVDTTAAGDTLLAELCWRMFGAAEPVRAERAAIEVSSAKWAVAAGSAACTMPGGAPPPTDLVARLASESA